ncbi:MAG: hypothetical protein OMM_06612 [Candidatus Magnetoglobus multicellularis str. Araruama]|uniref:Uncharacterized protein n=1 Tax=Candidatus Magnetoglobus multicellularis str. Araruama TaxID=890399 RepID=A0A1V1PGF7_9BACT|nr:MAG: hypothetical protein OMM_06612 [Candidatus Magnetoglobus multicellularis str. Araruama]
MSVQDGYKQYRDRAYEGQLVDQTYNQTESSLAEEEIAFGRVIVKGATDHTCKLLTSSSDTILGISHRTTAHLNRPDGSHLYESQKAVNHLTSGKLWLKPETIVSKGEPVYARIEGDKGVVRNDSASGKAVQIRARFETSTNTLGELAQVRLYSTEKK